MKASVPISLKVVLVSMFCVAVALTGMTFMSSDFVKSDGRAKAQDAHRDLTEIMSRQIAAEFKSDVEKMNLLVQIYKESRPIDIQTKISNFINSQEAVVSFGVYGPATTGYVPQFFTASQLALTEFGISQTSLESQADPFFFKSVFQHSDGVTVVNTGPVLNKPVLTLAFFQDNKLYRSDIRHSSLSRYFFHRPGVGIYIVNGTGNIVVSNGQPLEEGGTFRITKQIGFGLNLVADFDDTGSIASVEHLEYRSSLIGAIALGLTFIVAYLFGGVLAKPLSSIHKGFEKILTGQFDFNPDVTSHDEIGRLSLTFRKLVSRLQDRERLRNTLNKFSKHEDVEKVLSGETKLPLEKKAMTLLICELQSGLDGASGAEDTVKQVNALWGEIIRVINKYLGFIDDANGNFVRAVWGALSQVNDDGASALSAALEIRKTVKNINDKRAKKDLSAFKVGIGIHTGEIVAGQVGPDGRSEYTFVGQGAIVTSGVVAATRSLKADILVSEDTYDLIKNKGFSFGPMIPSNFNDQKFHQVIGRKLQDGATESELTRAEQEAILTNAGFQNSIMTQVQYHPPQAVSPLSPPPPPEIELTKTFQTDSRVMMNPTSQSSIRFDLSSVGTNASIGYRAPLTSPPAPLVQPAPIIQPPPPPMQPASPQPSIARVIPMPQGQGQFIASIEEPQWYLIRNPQSGVTEGPFTVLDLRSIAEQPGFVATQAYSYRFGDTMMVPLLQVPGVSRREARTQVAPSQVPLPPQQIQAGAKTDDWYVQREDGQIYGPYSFGQLSEYLDTGHISRNTFCWCQGMTNWLYAYQVPGLDRRQAGPPPPPIPLPKAG